MRIATWNVERVKPKGWKIAPAQRRRMTEVAADIWILTETHVDHSPGEDHSAIHTPAIPERRPPDERWVGIWSRYPIAPVLDPSPRARGTLAATVRTPLGEIIVYGCVLAWANEPYLADGTSTTMWSAHAETIRQVDSDLAVLRSRSNLPIVLAGDFNQDRDGSGWYGTRSVREQLTTVLERHRLVCVTEFDVVAAGLLRTNHLVDHICVPTALTERAVVRCWEPTDRLGTRLSDHPTVAIDIDIT